MALQTAYKQFLAAPSPSALAQDASLHYITSTTSFNGADNIIKHFSTFRNQSKKQKEDVLFVIEGQNAVVLEAELVLEFVSSGGPYLPGLDDNFLADRTVSFAITHIVLFNADGKILQIRQTWDQGSLLKQLDVIGRSGRNWPIRDGRDQITLITRCVKVGGAPTSTKDLPMHNRSQSTNPLRDPHASLALFAPREEQEEVTVISPYAGRRPTQRSFTEILGDEAEEPSSPSNGRERSASPIKPKVGAGKNFQPVRLFDRDDDAVEADTPENGRSPERVVKPHPKKYQHFNFDDGTESQETPKPAPAPAQKSKHDASWGFEDFMTPQKPTASRTLHKARDVRHWGTGDDVAEEQPAQKAQQAKGRIAAEAHFDFVDDGETPAGGRFRGPPRGRGQNEGQHLYEMNLYKEDGSAPTPGPAPLGNITNQAGRQKSFDPHFEMTDESPRDSNGANKAENLGEDRKKAVRMMESSWETYDVSPAAQKENTNPNGRSRGIVTAGDGMGNKKAGWGLSEKKERGIVIAGDGMGGRKGADRGWLFGEGGDEDEPAQPQKKAVRGPPAKADGFWDF
ncbi:hypothetical protein QBC40DRAFT_282583 [Triangularia verruculosa]|uniref:NTF2-like protein n=1 Tax=Triangularia verruculosa TaxID=2587418 RepID=A0AAN6XIH2_9PEZI|nr:hypothetical protein QBC40DRAFT_282583 [Triangularia verruculosa]